MRELVVATANRGKLEEIRLLLQGTVSHLFAVGEFAGYSPVVEDGETFADNALKKARAAATLTGKPAVADDSGLIVDVLGGRPGVHSARFAGEEASDAENNHKLLEMLSGIPVELRTAEFRCVIALCFPDGKCRTFEGKLPGLILDGPKGEGGFGYDPLFFLPDCGGTLAELPIEVKNRISHRGAAFSKLKEHLQDM